MEETWKKTVRKVPLVQEIAREDVQLEVSRSKVEMRYTTLGQLKEQKANIEAQLEKVNAEIVKANALLNK